MATEAGSASGAASAAAGAGAELEGWEMSADEVRTAVQADEALKKLGHLCPGCVGEGLAGSHDTPCLLCGGDGRITTWEAVNWLLTQDRLRRRRDE